MYDTTAVASDPQDVIHYDTKPNDTRRCKGMSNNPPYIELFSPKVNLHDHDQTRYHPTQTMQENKKTRKTSPFKTSTNVTHALITTTPPRGGRKLLYSSSRTKGWNDAAELMLSSCQVSQ